MPPSCSIGGAYGYALRARAECSAAILITVLKSMRPADKVLQPFR